MKVLLINAKPMLAEALADCVGVQVLALWPRKNDFGQMLEALRVPHAFYCGGAKLSLQAARQVRDAIRRFRPDVAHAFYGRALAHLNLARRGMRERPKIVSFRGITSRLSRWDAGDWITYRHPRVDAHACESRAVRSALVASGIAADRCWVTYNSMHHVPQRRPGRAPLAEFDVPPGAFVIGTVAAMRPVKGIDLLLRAAIQCADLRDTYWLLVGDVIDPRVRHLAADGRIRDRVRLVGYRPDASELISGADVFVMPSRAEALCQALLEAMYQGVCPVVSDAGGMKEVVRDCVDGLVFPSEDVASLAATIRRLHADRHLTARFAASARSRVANQFTPETMADRTLAIYEHLLAPASSHCRAVHDVLDTTSLSVIE